MVNIEFPAPWIRNPSEPYPLSWSERSINERHVKTARKGLLIEYTDGTFSFIATDDECYLKIKKALNDE